MNVRIALESNDPAHLTDVLNRLAALLTLFPDVTASIEPGVVKFEQEKTAQSILPARD